MPQDEVVYVDDPGQQQEQAGAYPPNYMMGNGKADLLDKIKPDAIVEVIEHKLMGEKHIDGAWVKIPGLQRDALTHFGASEISNLMLGVSSQNVSLSKLDDQTIRKRTLAIVKTAQYMMIENWRTYGIKRISQLYFVHEIIFSNTLITLKQSENEGIRQLLKGTMHETRSVMDQQKKEGGFLSNIFRG